MLLAGGQSKRMGVPKYLLPTPRGRIIDHLYNRLSALFSELLLVGKGIPSVGSNWRVVKDILPEYGALVGIYTGLLASRNDTCFVLACDMPFIVPELVIHLLSIDAADVVVPIVRGHYEPLCAVYRKSALPAIRWALDHGDMRVTGVYSALHVRTIPAVELRRFDPNLSSFINLNTPHQLELLSRLH